MVVFPAESRPSMSTLRGWNEMIKNKETQVISSSLVPHFSQSVERERDYYSYFEFKSAQLNSARTFPEEK